MIAETNKNAKKMTIAGPTMSEDAARFWNLVGAAITAVGLILGGLYTLRQYFDAREADAQNVAFRTKVAQAEAQKQYYAKMLDMCAEVTTATATIATSNNNSKRQSATETFWVFHYGPLVLVENVALASAMSEFAECLRTNCVSNREELKRRSSNIAAGCRNTIIHGLNVSNMMEPPSELHSTLK